MYRISFVKRERNTACNKPQDLSEGLYILTMPLTEYRTPCLVELPGPWQASVSSQGQGCHVGRSRACNSCICSTAVSKRPLPAIFSNIPGWDQRTLIGYIYLPLEILVKGRGLRLTEGGFCFRYCKHKCGIVGGTSEWWLITAHNLLFWLSVRGFGENHLLEKFRRNQSHNIWLRSLNIWQFISFSVLRF